MGRASVVITQEALTNVISELESKSEFTNVSALCEAVCATEWAKNLKNSAGNAVVLQPQTVRNRIEMFNLVIKTKPGKRGNPGVAGKTRERKPRSEKFAENGLVAQSIKALRDNKPVGYVKSKGDNGGEVRMHKKLVDKIEGGSLKAAVRLNCMHCVNYESSLVGDRSCLGCAFAPFIFVKLSKFKKESETENDNDD